MYPPRPSRLFNWNAAHPWLNLQCWTRTLLMPPDSSLPKAIAAAPFTNVQLVIRISSQGRATLTPSWPFPDLTAILSSPVAKVQLSTTTCRHESGSIPSEFDPTVWMFRFFAVTSSQKVG